MSIIAKAIEYAMQCSIDGYHSPNILHHKFVKLVLTWEVFFSYMFVLFCRRRKKN